MNRLSKESSLYLRQHAENPVDWYPWGHDALERARSEDRPIHLSVGYSACHWCHVMAHESYEDPAIARVLNAEFVNIKVDRQERPDLDSIYQKVPQALGIGGGWPLTVFLTPDLKPFYGGTYFPPERRHGRPGFKELLTGIIDSWKTRRGQIEGDSQKFFAHLNSRFESRQRELPKDIPLAAATALARAFDPKWGGIGDAPKFPNPCAMDLILRIAYRTRDPKLSQLLTLTLDKMFEGGMYDHIGGGFSRYSVDESWSVPHFEKMLYDNAQLISFYSNAYKFMGHTRHREIVDDVVQYLVRDMRHESGAFYASEDADSEGEEGTFYVFDRDDVRQAVGPQYALYAQDFWGVSEFGNFENGKSVVSKRKRDENPELTSISRKLLFEYRKKRKRPARDENILMSWNSLLVTGLSTAYQATGLEKYLRIAEDAMAFLSRELRGPGGEIFHSWQHGHAKGPSFLDDYSNFALASLDLYESTLNDQYLIQSRDVLQAMIERFWNGEIFLFVRKGAQDLLLELEDHRDGAWPSSTTSAAFSLARFLTIESSAGWTSILEKVFSTGLVRASSDPFGSSGLLAAFEFWNSQPFVVKTRKANLSRIHRVYQPHRVLASSGGEEAQICRTQTCRIVPGGETGIFQATISEDLSQRPQFYEDELHRSVFTRDSHLMRGHCCKSGCLHCPYEA